MKIAVSLLVLTVGSVAACLSCWLWASMLHGIENNEQAGFLQGVSMFLGCVACLFGMLFVLKARDYQIAQEMRGYVPTRYVVEQGHLIVAKPGERTDIPLSTIIAIG